MELTKEWVLSLPKTINDNGCWIPLTGHKDGRGYAQIMIGKERYKLHRLVMCIYYNQSYIDDNLVTRHNKDCVLECFNFEHLKPGTQGDNNRDAVEHGTNFNTAKKRCPRCGGSYHDVKAKSRNNKRITRRCRACYNKNKAAWRKRTGRS